MVSGRSSDKTTGAKMESAEKDEVLLCSAQENGNLEDVEIEVRY